MTRKIRPRPPVRAFAAEIADIRTLAGAGRVLRGAARSGVLAAVVETAIGAVEAGFGLYDGHKLEAAGRHMARKAAGGFVVGAAASLTAEAAAVVIGAGLPAVIAGVVGGAAAAKLVGRLLGPSPLASAPAK